MNLHNHEKALAEEQARHDVEFVREEGEFWANEFGEEWKPLDSYSATELRKMATKEARDSLELALACGVDLSPDLYGIASNCLLELHHSPRYFIDCYVEEFMRAVEDTKQNAEGVRS